MQTVREKRRSKDAAQLAWMVDVKCASTIERLVRHAQVIVVVCAHAKQVNDTEMKKILVGWRWISCVWD